MVGARERPTAANGDKAGGQRVIAAVTPFVEIPPFVSSLALDSTPSAGDAECGVQNGVCPAF